MSLCGDIISLGTNEIIEFTGNGNYVPEFLRNNFKDWTIVNLEKGSGYTILLTSEHSKILKTFLLARIKKHFNSFEMFLEVFDGEKEFLFKDFDILFQAIEKYESVRVVWSW